MWTDDGVSRAEFSANAWAAASDEEILGLVHEGLSRSESSDWVAEFHESFDPVVRAVFDWLGVVQRVNERQTIGYTCSVDGESLAAWLQVHRPSLLEKIVAEFPGFPEGF